MLIPFLFSGNPSFFFTPTNNFWHILSLLFTTIIDRPDGHLNNPGQSWFLCSCSQLLSPEIITIRALFQDFWPWDQRRESSLEICNWLGSWSLCGRSHFAVAEGQAYPWLVTVWRDGDNALVISLASFIPEALPHFLLPVNIYLIY